MTDVVVLQPIAESGLAMLEAAGLSLYRVTPGKDAPEAHLSSARAVITRDAGFSEAQLARARRLEVIAVHGTSVAKVAVAAAAARGVAVVATPGANARSVAELALALMLAGARRLTEADAAVRAGAFDFRYSQRSFELSGRTLGLVGFGHVARALARLVAGFDMTLLAATRHAADADLEALGVARVDLDELCARADIVSLHALPTAAPLFDATRLARMKTGAILINTARGALVDEIALADALRAGRLAAAGLDVFAQEPPPPGHPLFAAPRLVLAPHVGGATREALERASRAVATRLLEALGLSPA